MTNDTDGPPVTATLPDSPIHTTGVDHITLIGSNEADTIAFYRDLLGMSLVLRQPNLDAPSVTHLFFDTGDGRLLSFFVNEDRTSQQTPQRPGIGAVHHLAFKLEPERFRDVMAALERADHPYNEFDRGVFHSLYTHDHNGLVIELSVDQYDFPEEKRGVVLAKAQQLRIEDGAEYATAEHLRAALEALDIPVEPYDLPEAPTGAGVDDDTTSGDG
ncbi:VOC family protein [Halocatena halophila]|uniref:VOC family protein n=1 Tax=Halocatena halophila TaxID=2814576 RepID=UPI002ED3E4BF